MLWGPNSFCKSNATISDYFVMVRGVWRLTGQDLLMIAVYAPHDFKDKQLLWDYLTREIAKYKVDLEDVEAIIDNGNGNEEVVNKRAEIVNNLQMKYQKGLSSEQRTELESEVTNDEIKRAVWDCGTNKAPGPDGLSSLSVSTVYFDRHILDGPFILNEVLQWCKVKKKQSLIFKVDFEKAYDSVRSSRGSIIINGSPTEEFQFCKGLKQGDPLSPFLFILIMESLHLSFQRAVDAGMFKGIKLGASVNISHMFYADDAVFVGQWCHLRRHLFY
ncbi:RNA-directed DNA polymerase, eukaryota [Tanacetum coccineum]